MGDSVPLVDLIILVAGIMLILLTSMRVSRRRSVSQPLQRQTGALLGIVVCLGFVGAAVYLIFG